jgi:NAD(P) transhydrogenase subunit beta
MSEGLITVAYIVSGVLFILSLRGLSNQETARSGNLFGVAGMIIAVVATVLGGQVGNIGNLILVMLIGGIIGLVVARRVVMTDNADQHGCSSDKTVQNSHKFWHFSHDNTSSNN